MIKVRRRRTPSFPEHGQATLRDCRGFKPTITATQQQQSKTGVLPRLFRVDTENILAEHDILKTVIIKIGNHRAEAGGKLGLGGEQLGLKPASGLEENHAL